VELHISTLDIDQSLLDGQMVVDNENCTKVMLNLKERMYTLPTHLELPSFEQTARNLHKDLDTKPLIEWTKFDIAKAIHKIA